MNRIDSTVRNVQGLTTLATTISKVSFGYNDVFLELRDLLGNILYFSCLPRGVNKTAGLQLLLTS